MLSVESYSITADEAQYSAAITRGASMSNPKVKIAFVTTDSRIAILVMACCTLTPYQVKPSVRRGGQGVVQPVD